MARALSVVVGVVCNRPIANVAEHEFALDAVHFVLPALFRVDRLAFGAFDAPLNVDVGVSLAAHVILNQLLRN